MSDLIVYLPYHEYENNDNIFVSWLGGNYYVRDKKANSFKISTTQSDLGIVQFSSTVTDGYVREQTGTATTTISNLGHLEGLNVIVVSGGKRIGGSYTVSGGSITLSEPLTTHQCGIPYKMKIRTTRLEVPQANTIQSRIKNINEVVVRHIRSKDGEAGQEAEGEVYLNDLECTFSKESKDKQVQVRGGFAEDGYVSIVSEDPYPFTALAAIISFSVDEQR